MDRALLGWMLGVVVMGLWGCGPAEFPEAGEQDGGSIDAAQAQADAGGDDGGGATVDGGTPDAGAAVDGGEGGGGGEGTSPSQVEPCATASCWSQLSFSSTCGTTTLREDFSSGRYNVHAFSLAVYGGIDVELTLQRTAGAWEPALILHDDQGVTIFDGELGVSGASQTVTVIDTGRSSEVAKVRLSSATDLQLTGFLTGWHVIDGDYAPPMSTSSTYTLGIATDCEPTTGLLTPPNFDESDVVGGYHLLPPSDPPGLYTRKANACSRGNRLLIEVLYTVARRWNELRPGAGPIAFLDLNEGSCSTVDHATHGDGTHVDLMADCATRASCSDTQPAIELARLFIETGEVCGIIFNDSAVQSVINDYFLSLFSYRPWFGTFMRTVGNHTSHFHVRVKKPDGSCN